MENPQDYIVLESITKITVGNNLNIIVKRSEKTGDFETSQKEVGKLVLNYVMNNPMFSFYSLAKSLIDIVERVNSIEITNKDGNGCFLRVDWP